MEADIEGLVAHDLLGRVHGSRSSANNRRGRLIRELPSPHLFQMLSVLGEGGTQSLSADTGAS